MPRWLNTTMIVVGGTATVFSLLQFFGIDAAFLWNQSQNMSGRFVFLVISVIVLLVGLYLKIRRSYITPSNVRPRVREWLDAFGYSYQVVPWEQWHWGFGITIQGLMIFVARLRRQSDHLLFATTFAPMTPEQRESFNALSGPEKEKFNRRLALETAKARIRFYSDPPLDEVRIEKGIPITSKLAAVDVVDGISEIYFSAIIILNTIAFHLGGQVEPVPPSIPDVGALPVAGHPTSTIYSDLQLSEETLEAIKKSLEKEKEQKAK